MENIQTMLKKLSDECEQLNISYVMNSLFKATKKVVNIEIAPKDRAMLHEANYNLCFAKKVNEKYTVIWKSYDEQDYGEINEFSWTPSYEAFWTNKFEENVTVKAGSKAVQIGLGEITTIQSNGILTPAITGGDSKSINILNQKGSLHLGINQTSTDSSGAYISTPIYVAPLAMAATGTAKLTPIEIVKVWFQQDIQTSTMISDITTEAREIDLTTDNEYSLRYEKGKWSHI